MKMNSRNDITTKEDRRGLVMSLAKGAGQDVSYKIETLKMHAKTET